MAITEFNAALKQVAVERGIPVESIVESIKLAMASAYRKDYGGDVGEIEVDLSVDTGEAKLFKDGKDITPPGFGRIAAQTAKQVILQKIRETEKEVVLDEFRGKMGEIVSGIIFRVENNVVVLDLGKAQGVLPQSEKVHNEEYSVNRRLKVLVKDIRQGSRGPEIIVSRVDPKFVEKLFEQEVPEIASGVVVIEGIAREAGSRTKMAVYSNDERVDPVGSCVGQKGVRVQSIISELRGEKIDIIPYSSVIEKYIASGLSPAKVTYVEVDVDEKVAEVSVPEDQLSLAIGKEGQNVRLAAKLTKWKIDIKGSAGLFGEKEGTAQAEEDKKVVGVWDADIKAAKEKEDDVKEEVEEEESVRGEDEETEDGSKEKPSLEENGIE